LLLLLLLEKTDLSCRMPKLQGQVTKSTIVDLLCPELVD